MQDAEPLLDADLPPPGGAQLDELRQVVAQARGGDESVLPRLRELPAAYPELWRHFGDLAAQAREAWISLAAGSDLYLQETLRRRVAALQQELAGASGSPLVRLMVERVSVTWLQVSYADGLEARGIAEAEPLRTLTYRAKRQAQANRQHLMAIAALATIRKLLPEDAPVCDEPPGLSAEIPAVAITAVHAAGSSPPPAARKKVRDAEPRPAVHAGPSGPGEGPDHPNDRAKLPGPRPVAGHRLSDLAASAFAFRARLIASGAIPPTPPPSAPPAASAPRGRRRRKAKAPALVELV